ncbi:hypothetical protein G4G27_13800 [Sphingomonas sp. So64.6b]|uniref:hypothetical protein n=1 Tax=Sphingomonas sp. So64.6b TaxID=2997354 RepID=UPI00160006D9|nr:hypothetical protein [Sphingomonas sp. So64.6b]QNA84949.1 hypothetical protein G4G27_13800 [Sphingomonas sp. So64.6b]
MALDRVHLRKLLKLFLMKDNLRSTAIRSDAREVMKKRDEGAGPGGDFHVPFWHDAKAHAAGRSDLREATDIQIEKNWRRKNLYPRLRDGFLHWWNEKRRWINEAISELPKTIKSTFGFIEIDGVVKVENLLSLRLGGDKFRYIYPYFADKPALTPEGARLGLWLMSKALPQFDIKDMRILDVIRGESFSVDRYPLNGKEEDLFHLRYRSILREWREHFR